MFCGDAWLGAVTQTGAFISVTEKRGTQRLRFEFEYTDMIEMMRVDP